MKKLLLALLCTAAFSSVHAQTTSQPLTPTQTLIPRLYCVSLQSDHMTPAEDSLQKVLLKIMKSVSPNINGQMVAIITVPGTITIAHDGPDSIYSYGSLQWTYVNGKLTSLKMTCSEITEPTTVIRIEHQSLVAIAKCIKDNKLTYKLKT